MRIPFLPLLLAAVALSLMMGIRVDASEKGFWDWFRNNQSLFESLFSYEARVSAQDDPALQKATEDAVNATGARLRQVHPQFSPFFGTSDGIFKLVVTVHGDSEHFSAVDSFIEGAPEIEGWDFVALKQPLSLSPETEIRSGTAKLKVGDFRYSKTKTSEGRFDFSIYVPANVASDQDGFNRLFERITMDFLGERLASATIGKVTVFELKEDSPPDLLPFTGIYEDVSRAASDD